MKARYFILVAVLACFTMITCINPLNSIGSGEGTIILTLPARNIVPVSQSPQSQAFVSRSNNTINDLSFEITFTGPGGQIITRTAGYGDTVTISVALGTWEVTIASYDNGELCVVGTNKVTVKSKQKNTVEVKLAIAKTDFIDTYLSSTSVGDTPESPVDLSLAIQLSDSNWIDVLNTIENSSKQYFALDLSACTRSDDNSGGGLWQDGTFDPRTSTTAGTEKIVSLVLPEAADSVAADPLGDLGNGTFSSFTNLYKVNTGNGVTTIGMQAFPGWKVTRLTSLTLGNNVTSIGDKAFCDNLLTSLTIPESVISIGIYTFGGNQLTSVTIPNSVTSIGEDAFQDDLLTSVTIPNSITSIEGGAFSFNQLTSVTIPDSVTSIGDYAFQNNQLTSVTIPNNVTTIGNNAFSGNKLTSVTIADSVTSIGDCAFQNNQLTSVIFKGSGIITFSESVFDFGGLPTEYAANGAGTYTWDGSNWIYNWNLDFNSNLSSIASYLAAQSSGNSVNAAIDLSLNIQLTEATWKEILLIFANSGKYINLNLSTCTRSDNAGDSAGLLPDGTFAPRIGTTGITAGMSMIVSLVLPEAGNSIAAIDVYNSIEPGTFYGFTNLRILNTGNGITTIGDSAFNQSNLTSIIFGANVTTIRDYAFASNQLTSVTIPSNITSIGDGAFSYNKLTSVIIPDSVTTIGNDVFSGNSLTSVNIPNNVIYLGDGAFSHNKLISVTIPNSVTTIGNLAFYANQLTSVTIPNSVTTIGDSAFYVNQLTSVTIPNSVTTIGNSAFANNQLTSVNIPNSVTTIGDSAFSRNQLTSVNIPNSVTSIGSRAFYYNNQLTIVTFEGNNVSTFGTAPFDYGNLPAAYTLNGAETYTWDGSAWIWVPSTNLGAIASYLLAQSGGTTIQTAIDLSLNLQLTAIIWKGILTDIGSVGKYVNLDLSACTRSGDYLNSGGLLIDGTFDPRTTTTAGMDKIVSLVLPDAAVSIAADYTYNGTFINFINLRTLNTGNGITTIGDYAFYGCNQLTNVIIGRDNVAVYTNAFNSYLYSYGAGTYFWDGNDWRLVFNDIISYLTAQSGGNTIETAVDLSVSPQLTGIDIYAVFNSIGVVGKYVNLDLSACARSDNGYYNLPSFLLPNGTIQGVTSDIGMDKIVSLVLPGAADSISDDYWRYFQYYFTNLRKLNTGNGITTIGSYAFYDCQLTDLIIGNNVTTIGDSAFYGNQLTSLTLGNNVKIIGDSAFCGNQLTSVSIPNNVTNIGYCAFNSNQLTNLIIGNSVVSIGDSAFGGNLLTSVVITNSVNSIGIGAFNYNQLITLSIPSNVKSIGDSAFDGNPLTSIIFEGNDIKIGSNAFNKDFYYGFNGAGTNNWENGNWHYIFSDIISYLAAQSGGNTIATAINLPVSYQLTEANWDSILNTIGTAGKFVNLDLSACTRSTNVTEKIGLLPNGTFNLNYLITGGMDKIVSLNLPEAADNLPDDQSGFIHYYYTNLRKLNTSNGIKTIGSYVFYGCQLTDLIIGNSVVSIGDFAFENNQLTNLILGNNVLSIGSATFYNNQLSDLAIPNSVVTIGNSAFTGNPLTSIIFEGNNAKQTYAFDYDFDYKYNGVGTYILDNGQWHCIFSDIISDLTSQSSGNTIESALNLSVNQQLNGAAWDGILYAINIADKYVNLDLSACTRSTNATDIFGLLLNGTINLNNFDLYGMDKIVSLVLPDAADSIPANNSGAGNFYNFINLHKLNTSNGITTIGGYAFYNCQLTDLIIGNNVTTIGSLSFYGNQLTNLTLGNNVQTIGDWAFIGNQLTSLTISNSVITIRDLAFQNNPLTSVTFEGDGVTIGSSVFDYGDLPTAYAAYGAGTYTWDGSNWNWTP